jgi:twinkle protein
MTASKKESKATTKTFDLEYCEKSIKTVSSQKDALLDIFRNGRKKGTKTHIRDIDHKEFNGYPNKVWSWKEGEFNIWTGYNNEGKSQFLIFLCLLKAIKDGWKFAFFSPENDPPAEFFDDLIHTIIGRSTDRNIKGFDVTEKEYLEAFTLIESSFFFVYPEDEMGKPDYTIENIEKIFEYMVFEKGIKSVIVDPYIKIKHLMNPGEPEHLYASRFMMDRIHFTRKQNVSYHLIMHQTTPRREKETGNFPEPNIYMIKGGGTFADSCDNVLTIWRPNRFTDPTCNEVVFSSQKIKKQKLVGVPSSVRMKFNRKTNRYNSMDGYDYLDGSIEQKELPKIKEVDYYNPDKFHTTGQNDFEDKKAPF